MTCDLTRATLDAYVDESASPEEVAAIETHMHACPACAAEALARLQLKRATRAAAASLTSSPEFRLRAEFRDQIQAKLAKGHTRFWKDSKLQWIAAAVIAVLLIALSVTFVTRRDADKQAVAELLDLHIATLASPNPVDVVSTDRHTVKPWFQGKLPFSFNLPELQNTPYQLIGAKLVYFENKPSAELLFELRKHQISAFVVQDIRTGMPFKTGIVSTNTNGFSVESWSDGGLRYTVMGDTNSTDIHTLGDLLRSVEP